MPMMMPAVKKSAPMLCVQNPARISPKARSVIPKRAVVLAPRSRMTRALTIARKDIDAAVTEPTNDRVDAEDKFCCNSDA